MAREARSGGLHGFERVTLKSVAEQALRRSGLLHAIRFRQRRRLRILMYHRFPGPAEAVQARLKWQCAHLRRYFQPVSMSEVARAWKTGESLPANALAITVDDGYRDFAIAAPIFLASGFKPAIFVVTGFLDRETWLWPDRVKYLFAHTPTLANPEERARAEQALDDALIRMPDAERLRVLADLPGRLETELPGEMPHEFAPLSWDKLKSLCRAGVEVGAHTQTHPVLSRLESSEQVRAEIEGSKKRIESVLDAPVLHFCYPNGTRDDYDQRAIASVRQAGFETAVTTVPGLNDIDADPFQLSRIGVDPALPPAYFERCVAGFRMPGSWSV